MTNLVSAKAIFALIFFLTLSHASFAQSTEDLYDKELGRILEQYQLGKISRTESIKETLAATKTYFPSGRISQAFYESLLDYSIQLDNKKITPKKYNEMYDARLARYESALSEQKDARERAQRQSELDNARNRQEQIDAYNAAVAQQQNTAAAANMLQGVGKAFSNSFGQSITQPMQICSYYGNTRYCQ